MSQITLPEFDQGKNMKTKGYNVFVRNISTKDKEKRFTT